MNYTATIEIDFLEFKVDALINRDFGIQILLIYFGDDPLNKNQEAHFIEKYDKVDLEAEVVTQFRRFCEAEETERLIEALKTSQL